MEYSHCVPAEFIARPNRFVAHVRLEGQQHICHVKNTARLGELLVPGATVMVQKATAPGRKTPYDLIAVYKGNRLVNIDSQAPNKLFREWAEDNHFFGENALLKAEQRYGNSRFDFSVAAGEARWFVEVKGSTLEKNGLASFPDAPTLRGIKHLEELAACHREGYEAMVVFIVQMEGMKGFTPNNDSQPAFGKALLAARQAGVKLMALECAVKESSIKVTRELPVLL